MGQKKLVNQNRSITQKLKKFDSYLYYYWFAVDYYFFLEQILS